jgi:uncharacterized membrane protein YfcA
MTVALAALAVFLGSGLQSATGFGYAMFAAPILFVLLGPREAVTIGVLLGLLTNGLLLATERRRPVVLRRDAVVLVAWSVPGLVLGAIVLREVPERPLAALVALAVFAGLGLRLRGNRAPPAPSPSPPRPRAWYAPAAGATSGALATSTSLGGPPLVFYLLARAAEPAAMRDTLAAVFIVEAALGLPVLLLTETYTVPTAAWVLLGAGVAGQVLGRRAFAWLRGERYERAVLGVLALSALGALAGSVL